MLCLHICAMSDGSKLVRNSIRSHCNHISFPDAEFYLMNLFLMPTIFATVTATQDTSLCIVRWWRLSKIEWRNVSMVPRLNDQLALLPSSTWRLQVFLGRVQGDNVVINWTLLLKLYASTHSSACCGTSDRRRTLFLPGSQSSPWWQWRGMTWSSWTEKWCGTMPAGEFWSIESRDQLHD